MVEFSLQPCLPWGSALGHSRSAISSLFLPVPKKAED